MGYIYAPIHSVFSYLTLLFTTTFPAYHNFWRWYAGVSDNNYLARQQLLSVDGFGITFNGDDVANIDGDHNFFVIAKVNRTSTWNAI